VSFPRTLRSALIVMVATLVWGVASAEVSTNQFGARGVSTMLMDRVVGITDGADPIPQLRWNQYRRIHPRLLLNTSGAIRHDGRPDVAFHPEAGWPFVTWAYNNGADHDIAFSYWHGDGWTETEFLTFDIADQVDPRIFVSPHGAIHIVWAVNGPDPRVLLSSSRIGESLWTPPRRLTLPDEHVSRPTVATVPGTAWVAYERSRNVDGDVTPTVVVKRIGDNENGLTARSFPSQRIGDLDPALHVNSGRVWLDWKFSDDQFAWVVLEGPGDHDVHLIPWTDTSWVGVESVRLSIQRRVMGFHPEPTLDGDSSTAP